MRASVASRLEHASREARSLVEAACVAIGRQPLSLLASVAAVKDPLAALDEAAALGLLVHHRRGPDVLVAPRHPLERAAVLEGLTLSRTTRLHHRWAEASPDPGIAWSHRVRAMVGPDEEAAVALEEVARSAAAAGRWRHAGWAWLNAHRAGTSTGSERLVRAIDAFVGAGELDLAGGLLPELTAAGTDPLADAVRGYRYTLLGSRVEAGHLLTRSLHALDAVDPRRSEVHHRLALHSLLDWDGESVVEHALAAMAARMPGEPAGIEARTILGLGLAAVGRTEEALEAYASVSREVRDGALGQRGVMGSGWLHLGLGDVLTAARELELSAPTDFWKGSSRISLWSHAWLARALLRLGQLDAVVETVDVGLALAAETGQRFVEPLLRWSGAEAFALAGRQEEADRHARLAGRVRGDYLSMVLPAAMARASVAQVRGDAREVLRALEPLLEVERTARGGRLDEPGFWPWHDVHARALVAIGQPEKAVAFLGPHEERALARGNAAALARLTAVRARALAATGEPEVASALLESASDSLDAAHDPLLRATLLLDQGQVLRRAGQRREAEGVLARARARFDAMGARAYVAVCDEELRAGSRSGRTAQTGDVVLTDHERRVAELVASGLSNRDVAARLFVTPKTVQYHLTRIYAQLGVRSRSELAARWPDL